MAECIWREWTIFPSLVAASQSSESSSLSFLWFCARHGFDQHDLVRRFQFSRGRIHSDWVRHSVDSDCADHISTGARTAVSAVRQEIRLQMVVPQGHHFCDEVRALWITEICG